MPQSSDADENGRLVEPRVSWTNTVKPPVSLASQQEPLAGGTMEPLSSVAGGNAEPITWANEEEPGAGGIIEPASLADRLERPSSGAKKNVKCQVRFN